jgi:hypothetical protein
MIDDPIPPPGDERRAAVYRLETVDITRLYALLRDADRIKAIGESIIKALITDVLRSKLAFDGPSLDTRNTRWHDIWHKTVWIREASATAKVIQEILTDVSLSEDEQRIVHELNLRLHE